MSFKYERFDMKQTLSEILDLRKDKNEANNVVNTFIRWFKMIFID